MREEFEMKERRSFKSMQRNYELLPKKTKIRLWIKILIVILCVSGLVYQVYRLFYQYYEGKTVISTNFEATEHHSIPAITICFPGLFSMKLLAEKYPKQLKQNYTDYQNMVKNATEDKYKTENFIELLEDIYENFTLFAEKINLSLDDLFKLSIPFKDEDKINYLINGNFTGIKNFKVQKNKKHWPLKAWKAIKRKFRKKGYKSYTRMRTYNFSDSSPIESMDGYRERKCFTFFSRLNKTWRDIEMDLDRMKIYTTGEEFKDHIPISVVNKHGFELSMHSPDTMPQTWSESSFLTIEGGHEVLITYNRMKTILTKAKYLTNCRVYNLDDNQFYRLRSDCLNHCVHKQTQKCGHFLTDVFNEKQERTLYTDDRLWNRLTFPMSSNLKVDDFYLSHITEKLENSTSAKRNYEDCISRAREEWEPQCLIECGPECVTRYYNYDIKKSKLDSHFDRTTIRITHNHLPDQITKHIPELTFTAFTGNFGGLLGMWMGLSALAILKNILNLV